jgi:CxxC-x17-CxxC domain-containing protein
MSNDSNQNQKSSGNHHSHGRGRQRRGGLTDVSAMGLTCAGCGKPVTHLPFTPKTDSPVRCMDCHDGGAKKEQRQSGGNRRQDDSVVMDVVFAKKFFGDPRHGDERIVTYISTGDGDSIIGFRKSVRFNPNLNGQSYSCKVAFKENQNGAFAIVEPALPYQLSTKEWLPLEELRSVLTAELTFEMRPPRGGGQPRLIAFHNGRATFPDKGTTVQAGKRTLCLLREDGNVQFALPISIEQTGTSTGLVKMFENAGHIQLADLAYVVLETAKAKPGVGRPKSESDVEIKKEYRSIYDLLSDPEARIAVTDRSNANEIGKAFRHQSRKVHPDSVLASFGGEANAPLVIKMNVKKFFNAVEMAHKQAIDILERKAERSAKPADDRGRRDRNREDARKAPEPAPAVVTPAPVAVEETAPAVTEAATAPAEATPAPETDAVAALAETPDPTPFPEELSADDKAIQMFAKDLGCKVEELIAGVKKSGKSIEDFAELVPNMQKFYIKAAKAKK